ncbi:hypothetical protein M433DRAFT_75346 [Acidomyces richmondensis BFW]|nr:hypothetical protein M433DRAFT_75346 [Acidomyces richmondensis BFW]
MQVSLTCSSHRRKCHRVRPMEVLVLGLERTGTLSMRAALFELGYYDVYHMASCLFENPPDADLWCDAIDAKAFGKGKFTKENWDQLLGHCMASPTSAVSDQPCAMFAEELIEAYPDAKIVLTVRDSPEAWQKSATNTVVAMCQIMAPIQVRQPGMNPMNWVWRLLRPHLPIMPFLDRLAEAHELDKIPTEGVRIYNEHNDRVKRLAPPGQFLEFNVKQGWKPLCDFLGKPVPDTPFPNVNDTSEFQERMVMARRMMALGYVLNFFKVVSIPAVAAAAVYWRWDRVIRRSG